MACVPGPHDVGGYLRCGGRTSRSREALSAGQDYTEDFTSGADSDVGAKYPEQDPITYATSNTAATALKAYGFAVHREQEGPIVTALQADVGRG